VRIADACGYYLPAFSPLLHETKDMKKKKENGNGNAMNTRKKNEWK